ncbi:MAG: exo-alpha-sialidase [Verrucomicrobiales bacterium]
MMHHFPAQPPAPVAGLSRFGLALYALLLPLVALAPPARAADPSSPAMLAGEWMPDDPHQIDYALLPRIPSEHAVIHSVKEQKGVNQHNYLAHHDGRYWAMWSDGPAIEDRVGQVVKFATSPDGLVWSEAKILTPNPPGSGPDSPYYNTRSDEGFRYIARGLWGREGELHPFATLDEAAGFFGESLALHAFRLAADGESWEDTGVIADNTINNFPPKRIPTGEWMMSRRPWDYKSAGVDFLVGGVESADQWESFPVLGSSDQLKAEEPLWWTLPDGRLSALFRDNGGSKFLHRSFSADHGRTWSAPVRTDFPDATSKIFGLRLSDGRYVLISNSNPRARDPLTLAISDDGVVFHKLAWLVGGRHVDYPHAVEHRDHLLVAFAGGKQSVELLRIRLDDLDVLAMPDTVARDEALPPVTARPSATPDWIDLGNEGETLHLAAELTVPKRGQAASLGLATRSGEERVAVRIDAEGRLSAWLYEDETAGKILPEDKRFSLLLRLVSRRSQPDELHLRILPAGTIPGKPSSPDEWTLSNLKGDSQANLAKAIVRGDQDEPAFSKILIAPDHAGLAAAPLVEPVLAELAPPPEPPFDLSPPHPVENPGSQLMLAGPGIPEDTHRIAFSQLPTVPSQHAVVSDARPEGGDRVNQHNYLVHHAGRFWAMWSDGPGASRGPARVPGHDLAGQHVSFATSEDGLNWSPVANLSGPPEEGYGWIARGFWLREGELLALASRFVGPAGYRGEGLQLHAFSLEDAAAAVPGWRHHGLVMDDALNNFEPRKLPSGEWMMSRRDHVGDVHVAVGGVASFDEWTSFPQAAGQDPTLSAEEPDWWVLPDGNLCALFRDNNKSGYLYRAFSADHGRTWTEPVRTNFPDARSKFCALRLSDGRYALVSNSNPRMRNPLTLALSDDGLVFDRLIYLVGGRHVDYPHLIEHGGALYIAFNTLKMTCEVLKVKLNDLRANETSPRESIR